MAPWRMCCSLGRRYSSLRFICRIETMHLKSTSNKILPALYEIPSPSIKRRISYYKTTDESRNLTDKMVIGGSIAVGVFFLYGLVKADALKEGSSAHGQKKANLPEYTMGDVAAHDSLEKRIWVCYKNGVYDITDFINKHPGGDKILIAAGGSVEPFWELYGVHKKYEILDLMEEYRIGNLNITADERSTPVVGDPYAAEPKRHPALRPASVKPFNAEPPLSILADNFITPTDLFYVRNHLPVPEVDPADYSLEIEGVGIPSTINLKLCQLKKLPKHTITAALQCAGNRRSELNKVKTVRGLSWGAAAIGNAVWSGPRLIDVLKLNGVDVTSLNSKIKHVVFQGLDLDAVGNPYDVSVSADRALDPTNDVILAYEMNGKELSRDHGYPVRVIIPGVVGARNVKWLGKIILSETESNGHWQKNDYKGFSPNIDWDNVDFNKSPAIQELPVTSAICEPLDGSKISLVNGKVHTRGYAWSGGGRKIIRVDISCDGGKTWTTANLEQDKSPLIRSWSWTLWDAYVPVNPKSKSLDIICKAVDSSYNVQPDSVPPIWNLRGVLNNAWYRVSVYVK